MTATTSAERLYGTPGAEHLYFDPASCYEHSIEPWVDEHDRRPRVIEEWTTHDPHHHLPTVDMVLEHIGEWVNDCGEVDENWWEEYDAAAKTDSVRAAVATLFDVICEKVPYRMADKQVGTHVVTWDEDGEPLLDGEPLYGAPENSSEAEAPR